MRDNKVIQAVAGVITLAAAAAMAFTLFHDGSPAIEREPHDAAGWMLARQAVSLLKPGGRIMLITRDTAAFKHPATDVQVAAFKKELRKANAEIGMIQALQVDPLRPMEVPPGDFLEWIRAAPAGSVIVSFMGPPSLSAAQRKQLREIKCSIVAFCPGNLPDRINLRALFEQDLLDAAIVSRRNQSSPAVAPSGQQAWFDQHFTIVTAANVGDLAAISEASPAR